MQKGKKNQDKIHLLIQNMILQHMRALQTRSLYWELLKFFWLLHQGQEGQTWQGQHGKVVGPDPTLPLLPQRLQGRMKKIKESFQQVVSQLPQIFSRDRGGAPGRQIHEQIGACITASSTITLVSIKKPPHRLPHTVSRHS